MNNIINLENMTEGQLNNLLDTIIEKLEQNQTKIKNKDKNNELEYLHKLMIDTIDYENVLENGTVYYDNIENLLKGIITDNKNLKDIQDKIYFEITALVDTISREVFKYAYSKAVKLIIDSYNYKI